MHAFDTAVGKVYSIQHFMVQFGSNLKKVRGYPVFLVIDDAIYDQVE